MSNSSTTKPKGAASAASTTPAKTGKAGGKAAKKMRTFKQMLEQGKYTTRTLQDSLRMGSRTVKKAAENPSLLSIGDVYRLADLMGEDPGQVLIELMAEIDHLTEDKHPVRPKK